MLVKLITALFLLRLKLLKVMATFPSWKCRWNLHCKSPRYKSHGSHALSICGPSVWNRILLLVRRKPLETLSHDSKLTFLLILYSNLISFCPFYICIIFLKWCFCCFYWLFLFVLECTAPWSALMLSWYGMLKGTYAYLNWEKIKLNVN